MMENGKIKSIERIEKKDGTVDFKLGIDDKLYILHNVEISQGNLEHNEDDSHSLSINFTFDYLDDKNFQKMNEDYVSFEIAKLLKEKGFKGQGEHFYEDNKITNYINYWFKIMPEQRYEAIEAPTLQMAMKWLREKCYCHIVIDYTFKADANLSEEYVSYCYSVENAKTYIQYTHNEWYNTYEEACEAGIKYCLENLI